MGILTLKPLTIFWVWDAEAIDRYTRAAGKAKLWVVVGVVDEAPAIFFRINSRRREGSVCLTRELHPILERDSWLYCGGPPATCSLPMLHAAMEHSSLRDDRRQARSRVHASLVPDICKIVQSSPELTDHQRLLILETLTRAGG